MFLQHITCHPVITGFASAALIVSWGSQSLFPLSISLNKLKAQLDQKEVLIQILRQQIQERDSSLSSTSSRPTSISPNSSVQNIRRNSSDSLNNRTSPGNSVTSLHNITQRSPHSSNQNISRSPVVSMQNLSLMSLSPVGSQQNLILARHTAAPTGSQERIPGLVESGVSSYPSSVTTSGVSLGASEFNTIKKFTKEKVQNFFKPWDVFNPWKFWNLFF